MLASLLLSALAAAACFPRVNAGDLSYQDLMSAVVHCIDLRNILKTYECTKVVTGSESDIPPYCKCFLACIGEEMKMLTPEGRVDVAGVLEAVELDGSDDVLDVADGWRKCDGASKAITGCEKAFDTLLCLWGKDTFIPRYSDDGDTRRFIKLLSRHSGLDTFVGSVESFDAYKETEN